MHPNRFVCAAILGAAAFYSSSAPAQSLAPTAPERRFAAPPVADDAKTLPEPGPAPAPVETRPAAPAGGAPTLPPKNSTGGPRQAVDPAAPLPPMLGVDRTRMHYDAPGDGSVWARGAQYKASFDAAGATYWPLFGAAQGEHVPLRLTPASITRGGSTYDVACVAPPARDGDRVAIDRGLFIEEYLLAPEAVEQRFLFHSLPGSGELVLRIPTGCALEAEADSDGLVFRGELGRVTYSRAIAIDARGQRVDAPTTLEDGAITIRVDAGFLATAALPLLIDPVVSTFPIDTTSFNDYLPSVAYDATTQRWLVAFQERAAAGDDDVYYTMLNASGASMWGGYVNLNNASWKQIRCANLAAATQFLVVAHVYGSGTDTIRARTIEADIASMGGEFFVSGSETGGKINPAVGGDPYPFGPSYYCVAYQRLYDVFTDHDVLVRLVGADGTLLPVVYLSNSGGTLDEYPSVSRSNGGSTWTIAWNRLISGTEVQVWGGRVRFDGTVLSVPFAITSGSYDEFPSVSAPLVASQRTMVVHQRDYGIDKDVFATVLDGATIVTQRNLSLMEPTWFLEDQLFPNVETDGQHFLVAYAESYLSSATDYDVYVSDYFLAGNELGLAQTHVNLAFTSYREGVPSVASTQATGGSNRRFLVAWQRELSATNWDVMGALVDTLEGGPSSSFCPGDGSSGACPCGNQGNTGHGCGSSANPLGAVLSITGTTSTWNDSAVLRVAGVPTTSVCLFLQGSTTEAAAAFGDGLSCLGGTLVRLGNRTASAGQCSFPDVPGTFLHNFGGVQLDGGTRLYQAWYRNSANFCTSATFNMTNGVLVTWAR